MEITVAEARALDHAESVPLVVIQTVSGATMYFSDRVYEHGGHSYDSIILEESEAEESIDVFGASALNSDYTLTLRNGPLVVAGVEYQSLLAAHEAHPFHGALVSVYRVFLAGAKVSPPVLPLVLVAEEPQDITLESLSLRCSSLPAYRAKLFEQIALDADNWPGTRKGEYGKIVPKIYGTCEQIELIRSDWGGATTVASDTSATGTSSIAATSTEEFPDYGVIMIDDEYISYSSKSATAFIGLQRGYFSTAAAEHSYGAQLTQYKTAYRGLLADHVVQSVSKAYSMIDGKMLDVPGFALELQTYLGQSMSTVTVPSILTVTESEPAAALDTIQVEDTIDIVLTDAGGTPHSSNMTNSPLYWGYGDLATRTMTFPSDAYSVEGVRVKFTVAATGGYPPAWPYSSSDNLRLYCDDVLVATVSPSGFVAYPQGAAVSISKTQWVTSLSFTVQHGTKYPTGTFSVTMGIESGTTGGVTAVKTGAATKTGSVTVTGGTTKTYVLDNIYVDVVGRTNGQAATLMAQWLIDQLGYSAGDIDFSACTTLPLSAPITETADPISVLYRMAYESRNIIWPEAGGWRGIAIPDTPPTEIKTINLADLAGEGASFRCGFTPFENVANALAIRYAKNYGPTASESPWGGTVKIENVLQGYDRIPDDVDLLYVRDSATAESVGGVISRQRCKTLKTISFPVFWDSTDLRVGDTVKMAGMGFWSAVKFFINGVKRREGVNRATYSGLEWW